MKYLKYLQTANDFESFKNSEDYVLPNVSYVEDTKEVWYDPYMAADIRDTYLTIEALEDGLTAKLFTNACEYCVDGDGNWKSLAAGTVTESVNTGQTLSFRGELTPTSRNGIGLFNINKNCNLKGNCMSMLFGDNATNNFSLEGKDWAFRGLFSNCKTIKSVSANFLPATTLAANCYYKMFEGCKGLTTVPELPATTLAESCYDSMFYNTNVLPDCSVLFSSTFVVSRGGLAGLFAGTKVTDSDLERILPKNSNGEYCLPATTLAANCYNSMFQDCTSLTTAPALPATTLVDRCYYHMFGGCTALTTAPELPATTLADYCYCGMFSECKSLTSAPELPATTLAKDCYNGMFDRCTSLTSAPELPATTLAESCYNGMFRDCTALTTAPAELPATTLKNYCYINMFTNCSSLTTAPELPATTLAMYCYKSMFSGCSKLNYIKMLATDTFAGNCLNNWVKNVATTGTFVKNSAMTDLYTGYNGIPSGWTVQDAA